MRWFRVANLSTQITLLVAISLLLVVIGFAWMGLQSVRENTERTLQERLVIAQVTAERTEELLQRTTDMLEVAVGQVSLDPDNPASPANQESLKFILPHLGQMVHYVALINRAGVVVLSEPFVEGLVGSDVSTGKCIQKVLAGNNPMVTKVFNLGRVSPSAAILVGVKGVDDSVTGLVYAALDLEHPTITNLLKPLGLGETGYAEILDQNGVILASTWPERLWQEADHNQRFAKLIEESRTTVGTCHSCHPAGDNEARRQDVMAFAPLAAAPWGVAVRQSETEALAYSQTMERRVLFFGVGALLITLSCTWAITHGLGKPLHSLAHACHQIATGDLTEPIPPAGSGEVRALALSFDTMREKLKTSLDEIESWNLSLEHKVEQRTRELEQAEQDRRELLRKLVAVQEEERRRLARELHDDTSQALTALSVGLETAMIARSRRQC